ncbi:hypothetical protein EUX98_g509 [Antrodiella citrinella]|uniref:ACB domain-containing protein n=1 Tax=Antrodiella citrinella TaxID=2447956 RepID=A0A4S4N3P5_9APHY|nr:hypothetical protein EUX98_g509 [Antrodiella citrinella]
MDSSDMIDAQFDRAVEIVQGLPKTGPIQTGYEEKLTMYRHVTRSIHFVVLAAFTVRDVDVTRDAWAKHKDLHPLEAKVMYVEALIKVLRKYSDKTVARDLVDELEAFNPAAPDLVRSGT